MTIRERTALTGFYLVVLLPLIAFTTFAYTTVVARDLSQVSAEHRPLEASVHDAR